MTSRPVLLSVSVKKVLVLPQAVRHNRGTCPEYDVECILLILAAETILAVNCAAKKEVCLIV